MIQADQRAAGSQVIAESLKRIGVDHIFGIVGIPVIEVASACITAGIKFVSFRNEQSATYAASIYGYLTGKPGVALVVGGPGVIHALSGVDSAKVNKFPLLLLAGSSETHQRGMGAFQQLDQVAALRPYTKFAEQPADLNALPALVEQAYRYAYYGVPGATYIDLPADLIQGSLSISGAQSKFDLLSVAGSAPRPQADPVRVKRAVEALRKAKAPLLIIGKGAAYARAETGLRRLQRSANLPFLPTPMGKGVISDHDPLNVSAARSAALKYSDVIIIFGARLNWILHYGQSPKYKDDATIIQVDVAAEELGNNAGSAKLGIMGDAGLVADQILAELGGWRAPPLLPAIVETRQKNEAKAIKVESQQSVPLKYQPVYKVIRETLDSHAKGKVVFVSEGANTMDISRSSFPLAHPRTRLDAGTNATMGVGLGYAIAAKAADPNSVVVAIEGDSAFGFSAMEIDTAVRNDLPMLVYVMNNSGVYHGVDPARYSDPDLPMPPTALGLNTQYHILAESLGAKGFLAESLKDVAKATIEALESGQVAVINVIIDPGKDTKLEFGWMASTKQKL